MISLKYDVIAGSQTVDSGVLQCNVDSIEEYYASANLLKLLEPLFIPGGTDGAGWTINNDTFKTKTIVGTQTPNPQGGIDLIGFIDAATIDNGVYDLQTYLDNESVNVTLAASPTKAVISFKRNAQHDGQESRPLDYFNVMASYLPNRMGNLELRGLRVAVADATTVTFKTGSYIPINIPESNASYIHIQ